MRTSRMVAILKTGSAKVAVMLRPFPVVYANAMITPVVFATYGTALETEHIA